MSGKVNCPNGCKLAYKADNGGFSKCNNCSNKIKDCVLTCKCKYGICMACYGVPPKDMCPNGCKLEYKSQFSGYLNCFKCNVRMSEEALTCKCKFVSCVKCNGPPPLGTCFAGCNLVWTPSFSGYVHCGYCGTKLSKDCLMCKCKFPCCLKCRGPPPPGYCPAGCKMTFKGEFPGSFTCILCKAKMMKNALVCKDEFACCSKCYGKAPFGCCPNGCKLGWSASFSGMKDCQICAKKMGKDAFTCKCGYALCSECNKKLEEEEKKKPVVVPAPVSPSKEGDVCMLCRAKPKNCVFIPCGHQAACVECGSQFKGCPICKVTIASVVEIKKA